MYNLYALSARIYIFLTNEVLFELELNCTNIFTMSNTILLATYFSKMSLKALEEIPLFALCLAVCMISTQVISENKLDLKIVYIPFICENIQIILMSIYTIFYLEIKLKAGIDIFSKKLTYLLLF